MLVACGKPAPGAWAALPASNHISLTGERASVETETSEATCHSVNSRQSPGCKCQGRLAGETLPLMKWLVWPPQERAPHTQSNSALLSSLQAATTLGTARNPLRCSCFDPGPPSP